MIPVRILVLPQTLQIMREIQTRSSKRLAPLDLSVGGMVLRNEYLLLIWEFEKNYFLSDKIETVFKHPASSGGGLVSVFEEILMNALCDGTVGTNLMMSFSGIEGKRYVRVGRLDSPFEPRSEGITIGPEGYASWRSYLSEFNDAIQRSDPNPAPSRENSKSNRLIIQID